MTRYRLVWGGSNPGVLWRWLLRGGLLALIGGSVAAVLPEYRDVVALREQVLAASYRAYQSAATAPTPSDTDERPRQEVLHQSQRLTYPINAWLRCLRVPSSGGLSVVSASLKANEPFALLTLKVASSSDLRGYLTAMARQQPECRVEVAQEEYSPAGGNLISVKVGRRDGRS